jgi:hypothetical protein
VPAHHGGRSRREPALARGAETNGLTACRR